MRSVGRRVRHLLAALIVSSLVLLGTRYAQLSVAEVYEKADFVGLLPISEARLLGSGEGSCGELYTGQVIEQFKGAPVAEVEFGHARGFWFGAEYLLFLTKPGRIHRALLSTNSISEGVPNEPPVGRTMLPSRKS